MDSEGEKNKILQRFSWEPELLISGGLLFTLLQAPDIFLRINEFITPNHIVGAHVALALLAFSIAGLTVGFITHLVLKGFWIAWNAAKYALPGNIDYNKLRFSNFFTDKLKKLPTIDRQLELLNKSAGLIFSLSFWFLLVNIGLFFFLSIVILPLAILNLPPIFLLVIVIPFLIMLLDFLSFGLLKKNQIISKIYYPLYRLFSFLSLSFLYRSYYYTFISHIRKWKIFTFAIFFIVISLLFSYRNISKALSLNMPYLHNHSFYSEELPHKHYHNYLDQIPENDRVRNAAIQSYFIHENQLKLFVKYRNVIDGELAGISKEQDSSCFDFDEIISNYFELEIDGQKVVSTKWRFYNIPQSSFLTLVSIIPVDQLKEGEHILKGIKNDKLYFEIPFWKE
ncbi:MAG: hypothetical protein ACQETL_07350 [Bacteroidota bacterium]